MNIDLEGVLPFMVGDVRDGLEARLMRGVVDQDVDAAQFFDASVDDGTAMLGRADVACDQHRLASGLLNQPVRFPRVTRGASERIFSGSSRLPSCFAAEPKIHEMVVELIGRGFAPVAKVFDLLLGK